MSKNGLEDDASALLYLVPFLASAVYAVIVWVQNGVSVWLPSSVYLTVTRDPYLFALGTFAVIGALVLDVRSADPVERPSRLTSAGNRLQSIAFASLILVVICAFYANQFDVTGAVTDFIIGRFGLVFPGMLILLSYLVTAKFQLQSLRDYRVIGIIAMLLVPVSLYEIGKRETAVGLAIALVLIVIGIAPYLLPKREKEQPKTQ
jgi:hypothetical protein